MKQPIILLYFILFLTRSIFASGEDKRLLFSVKETNYTDFIVLRLEKNLTDDTLVFLTNTCEHSGLYSIDGGAIFSSIRECDISGPEFIVLTPHGNYLETINVGISHLKKGESFRVGINLVDPAEKLNPQIAWREKDSKNETLYSDYIQIT